MRHRLAVLLCAALALLAFSHADSTRAAGEKKTGGIEGVKGTVYIIDGNKNKTSKVTAQPHDTVVIEFTYPISPPFPKSAHQKSSEPDVVKGVGVHRVVQVKGPIGTGRIAAVFSAEKKGKATLTFDISHGADDIKISCEVEVK